MAPRGKTSSDEKVVKHTPAPDPTQALSAAIALFDEEFEKLSIYGKIATISGYLGRIPKNGHNNFNNYDYVLESDLVEWIKYYLAAARILIFPETFRVHDVYTFEGQLRDGKPRDILTDNIVVYRVVDGRDGESFTFEVNGQGSDPRDKGSNKASTSAMKFAYMRLFNISSGEDAEGDEAGDQRAAVGTGQVESVKLTESTAEGAGRGGKQEKASGTQIKAVSNLSNQLDLGAAGLVRVIERILGDKIELPEAETEHSKVLAGYLKERSGEQIGQLIYALNEMVKSATAAGDEPA